jgi:hypothetical protein
MTDEANVAQHRLIRCGRLPGVDTATATALIDESAKRAGLIWVRRDGATSPARPLWQVWADGHAYVLTGGIEQPMPEGLDQADATAEVTVASKDKRSRLVVWTAAVAVVAPGSEEWDATVPLLQAKRLNSPDGEAAPVRWAADCTLWRLTPTGEVLQTPDQPSTASHATAPPPTVATTPVPRPWHLFGRSRRHVD